MGDIDILLAGLAEDRSCDENYLVTEVFTEEDIPVLLMHLMSEGIGIYAVNVIEPSLEEIFLEQHVLNLKD